MEFKHLKLFGMSSAVTLLFCFEADGMNWQQALKNIGIRENNPEFVRIANTPIHQLRNGVVISETKKEDPKNGSTSNSKKEKRNTVKKEGKSSVISEQEFAQWIGKFEENLVDPEELHFFLNSANYICQLIEQGANIRRNGVNYSNQCPILALNLDEDTMLRVYDEMDKFNDYGHNFANYMRGNGGLSDGDQKTWSRISDIIRHRVAIYTRHSDFLVCTIHGENKELPVKRVYLEPSHYQELLINKKQNAETSEQRNKEEQSRETEAPKQEKQKTVEDVRKEFIDAIKAEKNQGKEKIDILKNIFENSGLTDNEELKKDMNLLLSFFGTRLGDFNFICENVSARMGEFYEACRKFFVDEHLKQLRNQNAVDISQEELDMLSKTLEKAKGDPEQIVLINLLDVRKKNSLGLESAKQLVAFWKNDRDGRKIDDDLSTLLKGELNRRISSINDLDEQIKRYQNALESLEKNRIFYNNPTLEQVREFSIVQAEKAVRSGAITMQIGHHDCISWNICSALRDAVSANGGQLKGTFRKLYSKGQYASAFNILISSNRKLFNDPKFIRRREVADLFERLRPRVQEKHGDEYEAVFELVSRL